MNITDITFGLKDVIAIIIGTATGVGVIWAMRSADGDNKKANAQTQLELDTFKKDVLEKFVHAKNAKKANIEMIFEEINKNKVDVEKKEVQIYTRITEIRTEQKEAHDKLSIKMDVISTQMGQVNTNLAELTGFIKASTKKDK